jgi:hypothetical protein
MKENMKRVRIRNEAVFVHFKIQTSKLHAKKNIQDTCNSTLRRFCETIFAVENQEAIIAYFYDCVLTILTMYI